MKRDLKGVEGDSEQANRAGENIGAGFERGAKRSTGALAGISRAISGVRKDAARGAGFTVKADFDDAGVKSGIADLKRSTATADDTVHVNVDFDRDRLAEASQGFGELSGKIREFRTVSAAVAGVPALVAAVGGAVPLVTALSGAVGQLAIGIGQGLAGAAAIGGTAVAGAAGGLKIYQAALTSTVSASREAYEATHEHRMELLEQRRQQILNTDASIAFNKQLDASSVAWTRVQAAIGRAAFPTFTRELRAWTGLVPQLQKPLMDLVVGVTRIGGALSQSLRTGQNFMRLRDVLAFVARQGNLAAGAISNLVKTGLLVANQLIPYADRLSLSVARLISDFQRFAESERGTRALAGVFALLNARMNQVFKIAGNLGSALYGVLRGLNFGGQVSALMRALVGVTGEFARIMEKGGGARLAIARFMQSSKPALTAVWNLAKTVAREFGLLASNLVRAGQSGGRIGTLATVVNSLTASVRPLRLLLQDTFIALGPVLARLIPEVARFAQTFLGSSGPLKTFLTTVTNVLAAFNRLPAPVRNSVASLVALKAIMSGLGLSGAITGFASLATQMTQTALLANMAGARFGGLGLMLTRLKTMALAAGAALRTTFLFFLTNPIGIAITAIAVAGLLVWRNWSKIRPVLQPLVNLFNRVKTAVGNLANVFTGVLTGNVEKARRSFARLPAGLRPFALVLARTAGQIRVFVAKGLNFLRTQAMRLVAWWRQSWPEIQRVSQRVFSVVGRIVKTVLGGAFRFIRSQVQLVARWWKQNFGLIRQTALTVFNAVKRSVTADIRAVWSVIRSVVGALVRFWKLNHNQIESIARSVWRIISTVVKTALKVVLGVVRAALQALTGDWRGAFDTLLRTGKTVLNAVVTVVKNLLNIVVQNFKVWGRTIGSVTSSALEAVKNSVSDKLTAAKNRGVEILASLLSAAKSKYEDIKSATQSAFEAVRDRMVNPISDAYDSVVDFIDRLLSAVNRVLELVGLDPVGSSGDSGSTGKSAGNGGRGGPQGLSARYRTRGYAEGGRVKERPGGVYRVAEAGKPEWVVNPNSRGYLSHLRGAAAEGGYDVVKRRSHRSREGEPGTKRPRHPRVPASRRRNLAPRGAGVGAEWGLGPTTYNWSPLMRGYVDQIESKFPTKLNTYTNHPGGEQNSADLWNPGGRGDPIAGSVGDQGANWIIDNVKELNWLIWQGKMLDAGGWQPYSAYGGHYDHVHFTAGSPGEYLASGGGKYSGSGTAGGGNPMSALFEAAWERLVQKPVVDPLLGPLKEANYVLVKAAGAAAQQIPDKVKAWISEKLGAMGGSGGSGDWSGGGNVDQWISEGFKVGGVFPDSASNHAAMKSRVMQESGGDPNAVNNWDVNAQNGTPSKGLVQIIEPTWNANTTGEIGQFDPNWDNPIKSVAVSSRYMKSQYGYVVGSNGQGYSEGGMPTKPHKALVEPHDLYLPLDNVGVMRTAQTALGTAELRADFNRQFDALRDDLTRGGIRVSGYGQEAREIIVAGGHAGGIRAIRSGEGRSAIESQTLELSTRTRMRAGT